MVYNRIIIGRVNSKCIPTLQAEVCCSQFFCTGISLLSVHRVTKRPVLCRVNACSKATRYLSGIN